MHRGSLIIENSLSNSIDSTFSDRKPRKYPHGGQKILAGKPQGVIKVPTAPPLSLIQNNRDLDLLSVQNTASSVVSRQEKQRKKLRGLIRSKQSSMKGSVVENNRIGEVMVVSPATLNQFGHTINSALASKFHSS